MDPNLHVVDLVRQRKQGFTELRRAGGVHDVVRDGIPFLGPAEESLVEFLVVILVVIHRHGVGSGRKLVKANLYLAVYRRRVQYADRKFVDPQATGATHRSPTRTSQGRHVVQL